VEKYHMNRRWEKKIRSKELIMPINKASTSNAPTTEKGRKSDSFLQRSKTVDATGEKNPYFAKRGKKPRYHQRSVKFKNTLLLRLKERRFLGEISSQTVVRGSKGSGEKLSTTKISGKGGEKKWEPT